MRLDRPRALLLLAVACAAVAGGLAARTDRAAARPAQHSVGPSPDQEGAPLTDVCSRRVGCLLR